MYVLALDDLASPASLRVRFANAASESLVAVAPEGIEGRLLGDCFPASLEPGGIGELYYDVILEGVPRDLGVRPSTQPNALRRRLQIGAYPLDESSIVVLVHDVDVEPRHIAALAAIVESAGDAILSKDLDGTILTWNRAAETLYGYTPEEIIGRPVATLLPADRPTEMVEILARLRRGETVSHFETVRTCKDGTALDVSVTISPIRGPSGEVIGGTSIARDISERRRLEEQVRHAVKMEAVGRLAGGIAHDFNNLLTAINGYAALWLDRNEASLDSGPIREVLRAGELAAELTHELLSFGRTDPSGPELVDVNEVVTVSENLLQRLLGDEIRVTLTLTDGLPTAACDAGKLEQILVNLVVNARDAMPDGGTVSFSTDLVELGAA